MAVNTMQIKLRASDGAETRLWAPAGKRLWDIIAAAGWHSRGSCGGQGACGKCKVKVDGPVSPVSAAERDQLMPDELRSSWRLACAVQVEGEVTVYLDRGQEAGKSKSDIFSSRRIQPDNRYIRSVPLLIAGRQPDDPQPLLERLQAALPAGTTLELNLDNLAALHALDRPHRPAMELFGLLLGDHIRRIGARRQQPRLLGLALDIGSTSLLAMLADLESGEVLGVSSQTNMQRIYGEDIMSRVSYCQEQAEGYTLLHQILINQLNSMSAELLPLGGEGGVIIKICAVGNPVMLHLLTGLPLSGFAGAPYGGLFRGAMECSAAQTGLAGDPLARLYIPPQLGGFVGADTSAGLLTLPAAPESKALLVDIGTNGEIALYHGGRYYAASAAAGPAFEGAGITCGARADKGAIDHWRLEEGRLVPSIIGGGPAKGICGSGLIELLALLLQEGIIDCHGIISPTAALDGVAITEGERGRCLHLSAVATDRGEPLTLDQEDIRRLQTAKSALRTAIELLLREAGLRAEQLDHIYLAGVFGSCINSDAAVKIGLLPAINRERVINLGNAAALGALRLLLQDNKRETVAAICQNSTTLELAAQRDFQAQFLKNIDFPAPPPAEKRGAL